MLKRVIVFLAVALLFCPGLSARAGGGVNVEVILADGVSVVVLTSEETINRANSLAENAAGAENRADFILPEFLTLIEKSAFEGIAAGRVDVTENVVSIEERAFADCRNLKEIHIPATVLQIDDHALDGCENVTVYGTKGSEAERFAAAAGFWFVDPNAYPSHPSEPLEPAVKLPLVVR